MPEMLRNHGNETAGAKTEDEPIPAWAKIYFHQQVRLLERMNSLVMDNSKPKQKKANVQCYKCGKYSHYARECRLSAPTVNRNRMVRLANHVTKYVIVHFLFWSCDQ